MSFEIASFVFLIVIFTLLMIFGSLILKAMWIFKKELNQMTKIIREVCGELNSYNSTLCTMHATIKKNQVNDDHNFII